MLNSLVGIRFHGRYIHKTVCSRNKIPSSKPMLNYLRRFQIIIYLLQDNFVSLNRCKRNLKGRCSYYYYLRLFNNQKAFLRWNFAEIYYPAVQFIYVTYKVKV